jgi:RNA-directed DNA polymerase
MADISDQLSRFKALRTPKDLARLLDLSYASLTYLIYAGSGPQYTVFQIRKRRGGFREISTPSGALKSIQRKLNVILQAHYAQRIRPNVHGFVTQRGIVSNARSHVAKHWVLNVDIEDFFGSINFGRVRGLFAAWPFELPESVATVLAQICCYDNALPQGAPTSPVISNLICARLDAHLAAMTRGNRCSYTRYADDLTISTSLAKFPAKFATVDRDARTIVGPEILRIIRENGFRVNSDKVRLQSSEERQAVTGLVINKVVNVPRSSIKQVRCMLHAWEKFGLDAAQAVHVAKFRAFRHRSPSKPPVQLPDVLLGKLNYVAMVRGRENPVYVQLVRRAREIADDFYSLAIPEDAVWVVYNDSPDNGATQFRQGTAFSMVGMSGIVSCWHTLANGSRLQRSDRRSATHPLRLIRGDKYLDLAILRTDAPVKYSFKSGNDVEVVAGEKLTVIGFPNWTPGQTPHVQTVTVAGRTTRFGTARIVVSEMFVAGMSGAPALNKKGEVVGVVLTGVLGATGGSDTGNQIQPISALQKLVSQSEDACVWTYDSESEIAPRFVL